MTTALPTSTSSAVSLLPAAADLGRQQYAHAVVSAKLFGTTASDGHNGGPRAPPGAPVLPNAPEPGNEVRTMVVLLTAVVECPLVLPALSYVAAEHKYELLRHGARWSAAQAICTGSTAALVELGAQIVLHRVGQGELPAEMLQGWWELSVVRDLATATEVEGTVSLFGDGTGCIQPGGKLKPVPLQPLLASVPELAFFNSWPAATVQPVHGSTVVHVGGIPLPLAEHLEALLLDDPSIGERLLAAVAVLTQPTANEQAADADAAPLRHFTLQSCRADRALRPQPTLSRAYLCVLQVAAAGAGAQLNADDAQRLTHSASTWLRALRRYAWKLPASSFKFILLHSWAKVDIAIEPELSSGTEHVKALLRPLLLHTSLRVVDDASGAPLQLKSVAPATLELVLCSWHCPRDVHVAALDALVALSGDLGMPATVYSALGPDGVVALL